MGFIQIGPMRTRVPNRCYRIFSALWKYVSSSVPPRLIERDPHPNWYAALSIARSQRERPQGATLSQSRFLNRQTLHLRPDPGRVIVRPFKPATEPRDLNPTDKPRANHIVARVLNLEPPAAAGQLAYLLENLPGRHRNLLYPCEPRPRAVEAALCAHASFAEA